MYECQPCGSLHPIKEMLRWPINQIVDAYIKEVGSGQGSNNEKLISQEENIIGNELGGEEDNPFNKHFCERCEKTKPKLVCFDCGSFGIALCESCS